MALSGTAAIVGNMRCELIMDERSPEPACSFTHVHTGYELFYVWRGEVEIKTDGESFTAGAHTGALIAPARYHQTFSAPGTEKFNVFLSFSRTGRQSGGVFGEMAKALNGVTVRLFKSPEIEAELSALRKLRSDDCFCREERLKAELVKLALSVYDALSEGGGTHAAKAGGGTAGARYRYEIDRLLAQNYAKDVDLTFLASELYLSEKRVSVLIKSLYGKSFRRLRAEMRVQVAKQLLTESGLSVAEVGKRVGYNSTRGFLEAFSELTGMTPSEYRASKK